MEAKSAFVSQGYPLSNPYFSSFLYDPLQNPPLRSLHYGSYTWVMHGGLWDLKGSWVSGLILKAEPSYGLSLLRGKKGSNYRILSAGQCCLKMFKVSTTTFVVGPFCPDEATAFSMRCIRFCAIGECPKKPRCL